MVECVWVKSFGGLTRDFWAVFGGVWRKYILGRTEGRTRRVPGGAGCAEGTANVEVAKDAKVRKGERWTRYAARSMSSLANRICFQKVFGYERKAYPGG